MVFDIKQINCFFFLLVLCVLILYLSFNDPYIDHVLRLPKNKGKNKKDLKISQKKKYLNIFTHVCFDKSSSKPNLKNRVLHCFSNHKTKSAFEDKIKSKNPP